MLQELKIWYHQGSQYIRDVRNTDVPGIYKGRPVISVEKADELMLEGECPTGAIKRNPFCIDLGKCAFCGLCAFYAPQKITFTKDYKLSVNRREDLLIHEGDDQQLKVNKSVVRPEVLKLFSRSLKLRQVSAAGDNSAEWELNAANNVQFDLSRFGIEFVASPRHADGLLITGPISQNMAEPLNICYKDTPDPKVIVLCGTDAISGGIFAGSSALNRTFLDSHHVDLFIAGNPPHPLTIINGLIELCGR